MPFGVQVMKRLSAAAGVLALAACAFGADEWVASMKKVHAKVTGRGLAAPSTACRRH